MSEAGALVRSGSVSASEAERFRSDSRQLLGSIPTDGRVNNEFHPTSRVPYPAPHPCPSGRGADAGTAAVKPAIADLNSAARIILKVAAGKFSKTYGFVLSALVELLWPSSAPDNVTWDQMSEYVDQQIGQAIDQAQRDHLDALLTGLRLVLHNYEIALQDPSNTAYIREQFGDTLDLLTADAPEFAPKTRPYLVLPEYTQMYNLLLSQLRDARRASRRR